MNVRYNEYMELKEIKGLGQARIETLESHNINTAEDLIFHFPRFYYDLDNPDTFAEDGKYKLIKATVLSEISVVRIRKNFNYSMCKCSDTSGHIFSCIWYNQTYLKRAINSGDILYLYGKNSQTKKNYFVVSTYRNQNKIKIENGLLPVYKTFKNIGQTVMSESILKALEKCKIDSIFPDEIEKEYFANNLNDCLKHVHYPENKEQLEGAKERLDIETIMPFIKFNTNLKNKKNQQKVQSYSCFSQIYNQICSFLPYELTLSQKQVLSEIENDMCSNHSMNRLVHGDVGSGKTVVSMIALAVCVASGYQAMMVAPTEILAKQHYQEMKKYFDKLGLKICFLSSTSSGDERARILTNMKFNIPCLIVGTQACLNDDICSDIISLIVIDEQHRFGVSQRTKLLSKCKTPDLLMLSATPIPRSMQLVYFGGIDVSKIEKPPKEKQIQTNIIKQNKEEDMWKFISDKIKCGSKVYIVCANIDENDDDSYQGLSAKEFYKTMCNRFGEKIVKLAHGKLDSKTEEKILSEFKNGEAKILVSTTIVEVGIDIKEADIMVIVSPEKFGLATLHQLRGRIGRAGQQSYCFCMARNLNETSYERIKFFKDHLNGFEIAEFDFESRGAGSIYGTKQHGRIEDVFGFISIKTYEKAKQIFDQISKNHDTDFLEDTSAYEELSKISMN